MELVLDFLSGMAFAAVVMGLLYLQKKRDERKKKKYEEELKNEK